MDDCLVRTPWRIFSYALCGYAFDLGRIEKGASLLASVRSLGSERADIFAGNQPWKIRIIGEPQLPFPSKEDSTEGVPDENRLQNLWINR